MTRRRTFPDPKPYTLRIYDALYDQEAAHPSFPDIVTLPTPNDDDEREQLAAFLAGWRRTAAKGEAHNYDFRLADSSDRL